MGRGTTAAVRGPWLQVGAVFLISLVELVAANRPDRAAQPTASRSISLDPAPPMRLDVGMTAPRLELRARDGSQAATVSPASLITFLDTRIEGDDRGPKPSARQAAGLDRVRHRLEGLQVKMFIIDVGGESSPLGSAATAERTLRAWRLDAVPVLVDSAGNDTATRFTVRQTPTTFLIDRAGVVLQRWDGFVPAEKLAAQVPALIGVPSTLAAEDFCEESIGTAPGSIPARPLSSRIWLIDGGAKWEAGTDMQVEWLTSQSSAAVRLRVTSEPLGSGGQVLLLDLPMMPDPASDGTHRLASHLRFERPGCYRLEASVTDQKDGAFVTWGEAIVRSQ